MPAVLDEVARLVTVAPLTRKGRVFRLFAGDGDGSGDAIVAALRPALGSQSFHARFTVEIAVVTAPWLAWLRQSPDARNPLPREGAVKAVLSTMECGPDEIAVCAAEVSATLAKALPEWLPLLDRSELLWRLRDDGPLPGTCARVAVRAALAADAGDEPATRRDADAIERLDPASDFPDWVRGTIRKRPRAVAVVIRDNAFLVIKRHFRGRDYAVLPGGSVEPGESFEEAAVRELWEETTLRGRIAGPLFAGHHRGRQARYFLMTDVVGEPELSGPELLDHSPENSFELVWATADQLGPLGLAPRHLRDDLPPLLQDGDVR